MSESNIIQLPPQPGACITGQLLSTGECDGWQLCSISRDVSIVDNVAVGIFYRAAIVHGDGRKGSAVGMTPIAAVDRALLKAQTPANLSSN